MISVEEAKQRITAALSPIGTERVPIKRAAGRVLAEVIVARLDQPPFAVSAMDGYAVRASDVANPPVTLRVIGSAPAGHPFHGSVGPFQAVRIFTGSAIPRAADTVIIQEDTERTAQHVVVKTRSKPGQHIRKAGLDFHSGDTLVLAGTQLSARSLALIAAADIPDVVVRRRPRVLLAATGDELSRPGEPRKDGGIVASSIFSLSALIDAWGGEFINLGILPDNAQAIASIADSAAQADLIVTVGGASVGDHDLVQRALGPKGFVLNFWKIAMRPGKPLLFGRLVDTPFLGLPGNPVSSYVCALLFLKPALLALSGAPVELATFTARTATVLPPNDSRQDYLRGRLSRRAGDLWVEAFPLQDSSMQKALADADTLVMRLPNAPAATIGDPVVTLAIE